MHEMLFHMCERIEKLVMLMIVEINSWNIWSVRKGAAALIDQNYLCVWTNNNS